MDAMKCPNCGKDVSSAVRMCPNCKFDLRSYWEAKTAQESTGETGCAEASAGAQPATKQRRGIIERLDDYDKRQQEKAREQVPREKKNIGETVAAIIGLVLFMVVVTGGILNFIERGNPFDSGIKSQQQIRYENQRAKMYAPPENATVDHAAIEALMQHDN